ncbi:MAG: hypothetical protein MZV63_19915 [Marinilabiliales bacterium]|nr:hypothetical protein [Marinilabiliales bacterium]
MLNLETDGHAFGPGRFDQYLYPYFRHSIDSGELTADQAQELLDLMWVKFDEITLAKDSGEAQTSSSYSEFQNLNIGGLTRDGRDATNELSLHVPDRARAHAAAAARPVRADQLADLVALPPALLRAAAPRPRHARDVQQRRARPRHGQPGQDARGRPRQQPERLRGLLLRRQGPDGVERLLQPGEVPRAGAERRRRPAHGRASRPGDGRPARLRDVRRRARGVPTRRSAHFVDEKAQLRRHRPTGLRRPLPGAVHVGRHRRLHRPRARLARGRRALQHLHRVRRGDRHRRRRAVGDPHARLREADRDDGRARRGARPQLGRPRAAARDARQQDAALRQRRRPGGRTRGADAADLLRRGGGAAGRAGRAVASWTCCRRPRTSPSAR